MKSKTVQLSRNDRIFYAVTNTIMIILSCFVQIHRHVGQCGDVNDRAPSEVLPYAGPDVQMPERRSFSEEILRLFVSKRLIHNAVQTRSGMKHTKENADQHDR